MGTKVKKDIFPHPAKIEPFRWIIRPALQYPYIIVNLIFKWAAKRFEKKNHSHLSRRSNSTEEDEKWLRYKIK